MTARGGLMKWWTAVVGVLLAAASACGDSGEADLVEVQGVVGVMDCPSESSQYSTGDWDPNALGASTADAALALLTPGLGLPPGTSQVESDAPDEVMYLFSDLEGHRLGRVVILRTAGGWHVATTERCG
jgi:hypothetical protein